MSACYVLRARCWGRWEPRPPHQTGEANVQKVTARILPDSGKCCEADEQGKGTEPARGLWGPSDICTENWTKTTRRKPSGDLREEQPGHTQGKCPTRMPCSRSKSVCMFCFQFQEQRSVAGTWWQRPRRGAKLGRWPGQGCSGKGPKKPWSGIWVLF